MPQLGYTVVEGTITKWLKHEGDTVELDEPLFEISTDKVDTEVPSPLAGKLVEIKVQEGETVQVGTELAVIDTGGDGQAAAVPPKEEAEQAPAEEGEQPEPAGERALPSQRPPRLPPATESAATSCRRWSAVWPRRTRSTCRRYTGPGRAAG